MPGPRREKVSDLIKHEVARLLQTEVHDARLGFITVTEVRMSPDLKHARVFVSILEEGDKREEAMAGLRAATGFIRRELGHNLRLRYTPTVDFSLDTTIEYGARIERLLESTRPAPTGPQPDHEPDHDAEGEEDS